jgi:hypothetical protein
MRINVGLGTLALCIYLILAGLSYFGLAFPNEGAVLAILAIAAGILLLIGK